MTRAILFLAILFLPGQTVSWSAEPWNGQPGVQHITPAPRGAMARLNDGSVGLFSGGSCVVWDVERSQWGGQFTLRDAAGEQVVITPDHNWVLRLSSGKLAALGWRRVESFAKVEGGAQMEFFLRLSEDDGRTWSEPRPVQLPEERYHIKFVNRTPIQLRSGRIVVPVCNYFGKAPEYDFTNRPFLAQGAWGSHVFYSDDEGLTWDRSHDDVVVHMADFGYADMWATFVEPSVIELNDGRVMMIGRTRMGQLFQSFSTDGAVSWSVPEPMGLSASFAPAEIVRIPSTGDLLIAWNQLSTEEVRDGLGRHRLTVAISSDEGRTWGNFKNLYALDDYNYIRPVVPQPALPGKQWIKYGAGILNWESDSSIGKVGTRGDVGAENVYVLPEDTERYHRDPAYVRVCYPIIGVTDRQVLVSYSMGKPSPITNVMDVFPVEWLYEPILPDGPYGQLVYDGKDIKGVEITIEDGEPFGWADALGVAVGEESKRLRVPVRRYLARHGIAVPDDAWRADEGPGGTLHAFPPVPAVTNPVRGQQ